MALKTKTFFLLSLCLNAVLATAWIVYRPSAPSTPEIEQTADVPREKPMAKKAQTESFVQTMTVDRIRNMDWASVESADYLEYIANLRSVGCPEETVRDIIIADVNKLYASKLAALYPAPKEFKFWQTDDRMARNESRDREKKRREIEQEKRELIKELLGVDYDEEQSRLSGRPTEDDYRYGFLTPEKQEQTKALRDKYQEMERALFADGKLTPENRAKILALRTERDTELAMLLGPSDYEQYQLRNASTARHMREGLTGFQPSEEEFKQIFQVRKAFDDQFAFTRDRDDAATAQERKIAQQQMDEQLKSVLGVDRFNEYQRSQDGRYRESFDFAQKYNLPRETADTVYQVRIATEQEKKRIQNDPTLNEQTRAVILAGLAQDAKAALSQTLGPEMLGNYIQRAGGWLPQGKQSSGKKDSGKDRGRR